VLKLYYSLEKNVGYTNGILKIKIEFDPPPEFSTREIDYPAILLRHGGDFLLDKRTIKLPGIIAGEKNIEEILSIEFIPSFYTPDLETKIKELAEDILLLYAKVIEKYRELKAISIEGSEVKE